MNGRWKRVLYWLVASIPLFILIALLPKLPEQLPMQYDMSGYITRMGNKNELLVFPLMTLLTAGGLRLLGRFISKTPKGEGNRKALDYTSWVVTIFMVAISLVMFYYTTSQTQNITQTAAVQILSLLMSLLLVVIGNILPKCKRTGSYFLSIGFRTPWTLKSDKVWTKINRLGGYAMVSVGLVGIVLSLLIPGWWSLIIVVVLIMAVAIWGSVYSWSLYKKEEISS